MHCLVQLIGIVDDQGLRDVKGLVHEIIDQETEESEGKTAVVEVVAFVPGLGAGQNGRDHESDEQGEQERQDQTGAGDPDFTGNKPVFERVAEQEFTDEGAETGGEHADMKILLDVQVPHPHVDHGSEEAGPHVQEIQSVEAVGDDQEKAGQGVRVGVPLQPDHEKAHADAAGACVQKGCGQTPETEIVRDKRAGRRHNADPVGQNCLQGKAGIDHSDAGGNEKRYGKETGYPVNDPAVVQSAFRSAHEVFP